MGINLIDLSRVVSHALRHEPWLYELEIDNEGWASVNNLLDALRLQEDDWKELTELDIVRMIDSSSKRRHEITDGCIRALYGHSLVHKLQKIELMPPEILFHGTSPKAHKLIKSEGLKPMQRQYVHLTTNRDNAYQVGQRKGKTPIILTIASREAYHSGIKFYQGNDIIWLANHVPPEFISE